MRRVARVFLLLLSVATTAYSQSNYASLSGTVFDPQQKVLAGCAIQLTSESTGASRQTVTSDEGVFQITGVLPGDYNLSVQAQGFASINQKIRLEVGQSLALDLNLKVATVSSVAL